MFVGSQPELIVFLLLLSVYSKGIESLLTLLKIPQSKFPGMYKDEQWVQINTSNSSQSVQNIWSSFYIQNGPWQCTNVTKTDLFLNKHTKKPTLLLKPALISKYQRTCTLFEKERHNPFWILQLYQRVQAHPKNWLWMLVCADSTPQKIAEEI